MSLCALSNGMHDVSGSTALEHHWMESLECSMQVGDIGFAAGMSTHGEVLFALPSMEGRG